MNDTNSNSTTVPVLPLELQRLSPALVEQAFTHRSLRAHALAKHETNERLEFLGDAVLELIVSEFLLTQYPQEDEGVLTRYRAALVRTESLALVARQLQLGQHLRLGHTEGATNHDLSDSLLADTFEATVGAIYVDQGYQAASVYVAKYLFPYINEFITHNDAKDAKTRLQEIVQARGLPTPIYTTIGESGPDHNKVFTVAVHINGYAPVTGQGPSKQKAQQDAADQALPLFPNDVNLVQ